MIFGQTLDPRRVVGVPAFFRALQRNGFGRTGFGAAVLERT